MPCARPRDQDRRFRSRLRLGDPGNRRLAHPHDLRIDPNSRHVGRVGKPPATDVVAAGGVEYRRCWHRDRAVWAEPGQRVQHRSGLERGPGDRSIDLPGVVGDRHRHRRDPARRRADPDHAAEGRRQAEAAAEVGAEGEPEQARGQPGGPPAGRATGGPIEVPGVAGSAEHPVDGGPAGGELWRVGLTDHDRPGALQAGDRFRHEIGKAWRAEGGADALGDDHVLDAGRHAGQRPDLLTACDPPIEFPGCADRRFGRQGADRVELRIERLDASDRRLGDLDRADFTRPHLRREAQGIELKQESALSYQRGAPRARRPQTKQTVRQKAASPPLNFHGNTPIVIRRL
jgi:hypothetical protein